MADTCFHIPSLLSELARIRPVFHSEADFQHALAWQIHLRHPTATVRLETPIPEIGPNAHLDVLVTANGEQTALELKYKARDLIVRLDDELYQLKNHSAQDLGRYDFLLDVQRLERIVAARDRACGMAILLTNDNTYWDAPRAADSADAAFRINEGRTMQGQMSWGPRASEGTRRGREEPITLKGQYQNSWHDYSVTGSERNGRFRYLVFSVGKAEMKAIP